MSSLNLNLHENLIRKKKNNFMFLNKCFRYFKNKEIKTNLLSPSLSS